eukprot:gene6309-biopygen7934
MGANLLIGDLKKAFLQVGIAQEDRDAFRFLFNINGKEEHLRFARVPFGAELKVKRFIEACEGSNQWNQEVSSELTKEWLKWTSQLKNVKVPGKSEVGEGKVLTLNIIMWGQNAHTFDDIEIEVESVTKFQRRLENVRAHVWRRWSQEYVKSLMDYQRTNRSGTVVPEIGEVVLIVGEEKNREQTKQEDEEKQLKMHK